MLNNVSDRLNSKSILLIGSGRLAQHLLHWNSLLDKPNQVLTWDRSQDPHALLNYLNRAHLVWLAISDTALIPFFEKYLLASDVPTVHFSGALHDPRLRSAHPLMTFPKEYLADDIYPKISFALTNAEQLDDVLPGFQNPFFKIPAENKALYHALCVVAGNFPQLLWSESAKHFSKLEVPEQAWTLYLSQVLENFLTLREKSLTGPLVRKDSVTMEKNEAAIQNTKLHSIYQTFRKEFGL